ncbi:MAG TPA: PP2C family protein-serine/threonine phosphatase [Rhodothermales bacterium]|nr:PP2C family protein-serine/threonine phosphatase [Rhodothermales bacterium]
MTRIRHRFGIVDGLLYAVGVVGFACFFLLLPLEHPDAAADYGLGPEGARKAATDFLRSHGYDVDNLTAEVQFRRQASLLDSLQRDLSRREIIALLKHDTTGLIPAYYWTVEWNRARSRVGDEETFVYRVRLNEQGQVWHFERESSAVARVDRKALFGVLQGASTGEGPPSVSEAITDSLLRAALAFTSNDSAWQAPGGFDGAAFDRGSDVLAALQSGSKERSYVDLGPDWAVALARLHLNASGLAGYDLHVDSVWVVDASDGRSARVRFGAQVPGTTRSMQSDVEVDVTGALREMNTEFDPAPAGSSASKNGDDVSLDFTLNGTFEAVIFITYFVLIVIFLFLFLRRLHTRTIDPKVALRDALWGGMFLGAVVALTAGPQIMKSVPNLWLSLFISAMATMVSGAAGAMLIFVISNVADSLTRGIWPEKLEAFTLARLGFFRNLPVGHAFFRGAALSGVMLGLIAFYLAVFPSAALNLSKRGDLFMYQEVLAPIGFLFGYHGFASLLISLLILAGVGTLLYQWRKEGWVVVAGLATLFTLIQVGPCDVLQTGYMLVLAGILGAVLAMAYWRYDVLTCFIGYLFVGVFWGMEPGWLIPRGGLATEVWIALGLLGAAVLVGLIGVASRKTGAELPNYVPAYVQELALEERLKGELEIAHLVQESFLPRRMPRIEGLDVAGMCLPAQEVGGDYFDFVDLENGRLGVIVGDVSGKGIQAAFYMTLVKGFFLTLCRIVASPAELLRRLNTLFCENAPKGTFISLIYGVVDAEARTFTFARAGHNPIIIRRAPSHEPELVQPRGMAIGLASGALFDGTIEETTVDLRAGDVLVFYTDGFSEAMNAARQQYGDARLARKVNIVGQRSAAEILRAVSEDVHHFLEAVGRHDDMTMVIVKIEPNVGHVVSATASRKTAAEEQVG